MKAVAISALVVALASLPTLLAAPKAEKSGYIYPMTYAVADLPVWRTNLKETKFAPEVLIGYVRSTVDPQSWKSVGEIKIDEKRASLVIAQTKANHEAISRAFDSFRPDNLREAQQRRTN